MAEAQSNMEVDMFTSKKLEEIFMDGWEAVDQLDNSKHPSNSPEFQKMVADGMKSLEVVTNAVSNLDLFSSNETIEEVSTNSLKYMLLPYFLGRLSLRLKREDRAEILDVSEVYLKDFLKRCEEYELTEGTTRSKTSSNGNKEEAPKNELAELIDAANSRNYKIAQYKRKKELEEQVAKMKVAVKSKNCDEEMQRDFYLNLMKLSIIDANEELKSIALEKEVLKMRPSNQCCGDQEPKPKPKSKAPPLQPFIITKNAAQKAVFGLGYPSLPIMTVDEFYDQRVREGIFPDAEKMARINQEKAMAALQDPEDVEEAEKEELENQVENDDPEYIARMRRMDEYKDVVRRGDGNRYNRS